MHKEEWKSALYKELNVARIKSRDCKVIVVNVIPFKCLDYTEIELVPFDTLWSGKYDVMLIPSDIRLTKLVEYHNEYANVIKSRRQLAFQNAAANGKRVISAQTKCWNCPVSPEVDTFIDNKMKDRLSVTKLKLY